MPMPDWHAQYEMRLHAPTMPAVKCACPPEYGYTCRQISPFMLERKSSYASAAPASAATVGGAAPAPPPPAAAAAAALDAASKPWPPPPASSWMLDAAANAATLDVMGLGRGAGWRWMRTAAGMNDGRATLGSERGGSGFETGSASKSGRGCCC